MRRLTYENARGEEVEFYLSPLLIEGLEGIGEVGADIQSQTAPFQDGDTFIDAQLEPRFIDLSGKILERNKVKIREHRQQIINVCNPKKGLGKLRLELDGSTQFIYAIPETVPTFPERSMDVWQDFEINWFCPNPYWRSPNETTKPLVAYTGGFTLPFTLPFTLGTLGSKTKIYNDGDVPTPVRIEIQGPTTNPQLFNRTTGTHLRINRTINADEVMYINTEQGRQSIEVEGRDGTSSAFGFIDHDSTPLSDFLLELGENEIEHVADAGNRHAEVIIRWNSLYAGV